MDRSGLPSLFEQASGRLLSYEFDKEWVEKNGVISNTLKNKTPAERAELLDAIYTEELICFLYKSSLQCYSRSSGDSIKINFSRIRPRTLKIMDGKYLVLVDSRGAPYEISSFANLKEYKENALVPVQGVSKVKTITQTIMGPGEGFAIGVNVQGQAVILNPKTGWEPIKAAGALKFKKVIPAEISEELENL